MATTDRQRIIFFSGRISLYLLLGVVALAVLLRFISLADIPSWYTDEGFYLRVAWDLIHGRLETFGISDWSFISPHFTSPPLYLVIVGIGLSVFGKSLLALRVLSALAGVATVYSLWHIGSRLVSARIGLVLALSYAVIPEFVVNNRWGFPQTLVGLLALWVWYLMLRYAELGQRSYLYGGLSIFAIALCTSYWVFPLVAVVLYFLWGRWRWKSLFIAALAFLPVLLILGIRMTQIPSVALQDLVALFGGGGFIDVSSLHSETNIFIEFIRGLFGLIRHELLFAIGMVGIFFASQKRVRTSLLFALFFFVVPFLILRSNYENIFYPALLFSPFLLLGLGYLVNRIFLLRSRLMLYAATGALLLYLFIQTVVSVVGIQTGTLAQSSSQLPFIYRDDVTEMQMVVAFVNSKTKVSDFVIAPNHMNWTLDAFTVEPVWSACYEFQDSYKHLSGSQFVRSLDHRDASYVIDDKAFGGDASVCYKHRKNVTQDIEASWPVVFETQRFRVFQNPDRPLE